MRKFWEFGWDCWINIFELKSFPKSISYNNEQSLKIYILLDTKRKFIICENSQLNTTKFHCLKKSPNNFNWIPHDLFIFYQSHDWLYKIVLQPRSLLKYLEIWIQ
jgi:hypothetical protein